MAVLGTFTKQPGETLDYDVDFTDWLTGRPDTIQSHSVVVPTGLTLVLSTLTGKVVKCVLAGGTAGVKYKVTVVVTTDTELVKESEFYISVKEF